LVDFSRVVIESIFCKIIFGNHPIRRHEDISFFIRNKNRIFGVHLFIFFVPVDGRFIIDATAYGSDSIENPTGENTVTLYMGYYTDKTSSVFQKSNRHEPALLD